MFGFFGNASRRRAAVTVVAGLATIDGRLRERGLDAAGLAEELVAAVWTPKPLRAGRQVFGYPSAIAVALEALSNGLFILSGRPYELEVVARTLVRTASHLREPAAAKELSDLDYQLIQTITEHFMRHPVIQVMAKGGSLEAACIQYAG